MRTFLQATWWVQLLRGLALLFLGFFAMLWPGLTLASLVVGFAVYATVVGVLNIIATLSGAGRQLFWFLTLLTAAVEVGVGVYALQHQSMKAATLALLVGIVFVVRGVVEVICAYADDYEGRQRSLVAIVGVLAIAAGIVVWAYPSDPALGYTWLLGLYGLVGGAFLVSMAGDNRGIAARV